MEAKRQSNNSYNKKILNIGPKKSELFRKINIEIIQNYIIKEFGKENSKNIKKNFWIQKKKPLEINTTSENIKYLKTTNITNLKNNYKKRRHIYNNKDNSYQYIICDYGKLTPDSLNNRSKITFNYNHNNKSSEKKIPVIMVSNKKNKRREYIKYINYQNEKKSKIIRIQSAWRRYFLRKIAIRSIKKYIGFICFVNYIQRTFIKKMKHFFLFQLKKNKKKYIDLNNNSMANRTYLKKMNNKKTKLEHLNYTNEKKKINLKNGGKTPIKKRQKKEKDYHNLTDDSRYNRYNNRHKNKEIQTNLYIPKKANLYKFEKIRKSNNMKAKIKHLIDYIKKLSYFQFFPIFLYRLKILRNRNLIIQRLQKLKNILDLLEKKYLKKIFNKYREHSIIMKVKGDIYKNNNITHLNNNKIEKNKNINNYPLKNLIDKRMAKEQENNKMEIAKYFKYWLQINYNDKDVFKSNDNSFNTKRDSTKKHVKIKCSHDLSFKTESSDQNEKSNSNNLDISRKKIMKVRNIVLNTNKMRDLLNSSFNLDPKSSKMKNIIIKRNNKNILFKYFIFWNKN